MENKSEAEKDLLKNLNERLSKWQMKQIDYLTFNINLILTLSLGILVYLLNSKNADKSETQAIADSPNFKTFTILLVTIVTTGVVINILRYLDFKYTKDVIKTRKKLLKEKVESEIEKLKSKLRCLKCATRILGGLSKCLFFGMSILFLITLWEIILNT